MRAVKQSDSQSLDNIMTDGECNSAYESLIRSALHDPFDQKELEARAHMLIREIRKAAAIERNRDVEE